jgi:hypothetical protein
MLVFASLDQEMDLMIGSLNFRVDSLGLQEKTMTAAMSESSVGSSSEVNLPVSFTMMEK